MTLPIHCLEGQRISPNDVSFENELNGITASALALALKQTRIKIVVEDPIQTTPALAYVVFEQIDAVDGRHSQHGVPLKLKLGPCVTPLHDFELTCEDDCKKISVTTRRL